MSLSQLRQQSGLSQREVARRSGLHQPVVSRLESGQDAMLSTVARYAKGVGVPLSTVIRVLYPDADVVGGCDK